MGKNIPVVKEEKDLGVFFSDTFKPGLNCSKACKSANKVTGMIRRNITNRTAEGMLTLYKSLVRPILEYCIPIWRPYTKKDMDQIERVQKRFTKLINGCKDKKYEDRLMKLGVTTLQERQIRADLIQVYKIVYDENNVYPKNFLVRSERCGRKNSSQLYKKRCNLELTRQSFAFRVTDLWNNLPDVVVLSKTINEFKGKLDYFMRNVRGQI